MGRLGFAVLGPVDLQQHGVGRLDGGRQLRFAIAQLQNARGLFRLAAQLEHIVCLGRHRLIPGPRNRPSDGLSRSIDARLAFRTDHKFGGNQYWPHADDEQHTKEPLGEFHKQK